MFWLNALGNFFGSLAAALVIWGLVTLFYELPRSKKERRELLLVSYALAEYELQVGSTYCQGLLALPQNQIPLSIPVTQGWEILHSTGAFRAFPLQISEKLLAYYSLLFRVTKQIELAHMFQMGVMLPMSGQNPYANQLQQALRSARQVAGSVPVVNNQFQELLNGQIELFGRKEKMIFDEARTRMRTF